MYHMPTGNDQEQFPEALVVVHGRRSSSTLCLPPPTDDPTDRLQTTTNKGNNKRAEIWGDTCIICQLAMTKSSYPRHCG